jgi:hypothetical protein
MISQKLIVIPTGWFLAILTLFLNLRRKWGDALWTITSLAVSETPWICVTLLTWASPGLSTLGIIDNREMIILKLGLTDFWLPLTGLFASLTL